MDSRSPSCQPTAKTLLVALAVLGALGAGGLYAARQLSMLPASAMEATPAKARAPSHAVPRTPVSPSAAASKPTDDLATGPTWESLSGRQRAALEPLAERWNHISAVQKRRWLAIAQTFHGLSPQEQATLHSRMADWANLSAQQRSQARLNYARAQRLTPDDKRAQWEAYQALTEAERRMLADEATISPQGAATAIRPVAPQKLAQVPAATVAPVNRPNPPKIPAVLDQPRVAAPVHTAPPIPAEALTPVPVVPLQAEPSPVVVPTATGVALPPLAPPPSTDNPAPAPPSADQSGLYPQ